MIESYLIELPPIMRSDYQIEKWKRMVLPRELDIRTYRKVAEDVEGLRDYHFPMHSAGGNCLMPSKCPCEPLCWGSAAANPLESGLYKLRVPNHPAEEEDK